MKNKITVNADINADIKKVWDYYTNPRHIVNWNFADPSWCCPSAENDMKVGGLYKARMEAKDGSFGFDFDAVYDEIIDGKEFTYTFGNRTANVKMESSNNRTYVIIAFEPENENPVEMQKRGWQSILDNFKTYTENH